MKLYPTKRPNEWVQPVRKGFYFSCCDCGLVHEFDFRVSKGRAQLRVRRNNRSTSALRRHREYPMVKP